MALHIRCSSVEIRSAHHEQILPPLSTLVAGYESATERPSGLFSPSQMRTICIRFV
ncbi:hypothetical protein MPTK1_2g24430 [Marchantia polymorpha subsp. ruderalis]|uniref:Uncharacterized protein n=1 Tax=Marchantia polymorpha TaxID=3197 RepID=A0A2R6WPG5_MARPO|nr:hypothetical protein MARPO_0069s0091 [Marchantia polymorpha]BBN03555.1 hypothetical protein Mp_2g24430 [Marchantia polymorpha subsp. ruderalis]|eukprot:PTQ35760.1 hypothetical protein MARPO_0069s0091 [Marchantia polymorpha]